MEENLIKKIRGDMTQTEFAKLVGVSQAAIAKYEGGRMPKMEVLERIAEATGKRVIITIEDIEEEK